MIYCISDIHGCLGPLEDALELVDLSGDNKLVLLGDYIHGGDENTAVLEKIMKMERKYGMDKVIVLAGNHEDMASDGRWPIRADRFAQSDDDQDEDDDKYLDWISALRRIYVEGNTIFVHAGIDEDAGEYWQCGTDDYTLTEKYPAETGHFDCGEPDREMKIVAGHVGTAEISGDPRFHDIFYDGQSHYYIDSTVLDSGYLNVLAVDTGADKYYSVTENGTYPVLPYAEEN